MQRRTGLRGWTVRTVGLVLLTAAGYLGGISATNLLPTHVETEHYEAQVSLSALPRLTSTIHSPTSLGSINLNFTSALPAPGIDAMIQIKENITDVFSSGQLSVSALQPSTAQINKAIRDGVWRLGLTFAVGALLTIAAVVALVALGRRRRPSTRQVLAGSLATVIAVGGTGVGAWSTYQPRHFESFSTTSLLGTVRRNAGMLADVETRAKQVTPYVKNLLALSQALQEKFVPEEINQAPAARFLLVSDIHGANQYPLMRSIVQEEHITAVIDSGDLLNFGSVAEAEAAGIFTSIQGLGVPYIFVRGNHDAHAPGDRSLLKRMSSLSNVVLLEPAPGEYTELSVNGVRIAGFNDPRYFGDDNKNNAAAEKPATRAYQRAFAQREAPDIVVSHEPEAIKAVEKAHVRVNGHLHVQQLEGNRIGVGTFTGGGTFSHFLTEGEKGHDGELPGQPYAFDIAVFGQQCTLTRLTRYTYRNLVQGRPAYDDVTVINGARIETDPPQDRTCTGREGLARTTVTAPYESPAPAQTPT